MQEKNLSEMTIKNAIILPFEKGENFGSKHSGVYDEQGFKISNYYCDFVFKKDFKAPKAFIKADKILKQGGGYCDMSVVFLGFLSGFHGHFITEELARLWWVLQNGIKSHKFAFVRYKRASLGAFERFVFSLFGLDESNLIAITKPTQFKELILPARSFSYTQNPLYAKEHREVIDFIIKQVKPIQNDKIYLSRQKYTKALIYEWGDKYVDEFFQKKGYKIVYPETVSPQKQLALYAGCKHLAAISGTLPHNAIFMPQGSKLTIIKKARYHNGTQAFVDEFKGLKRDDIDACLELFGVNIGRGPFVILMRDLPLSPQTLRDYKAYIKAYLREYLRQLTRKILATMPTKTQLDESFTAFKDEIQSIDEKLFMDLKSNFRAFERWTRLFYSYPKLAYLGFNLYHLPQKIVMESFRAWKKW